MAQYHSQTKIFEVRISCRMYVVWTYFIIGVCMQYEHSINRPALRRFASKNRFI